MRRYGFHGTSHEYVAGRAADVLGKPLSELDLIVAHLGNGASMTAVQRGRSVETSMGLSPLEGLVMGTRSGDVDPAVVGYVAEASGRSEAEVLVELNRSSGLLGLCGDSDMREITARIEAGDEEAELALDVFCHRIRKYVGAYVAVLGGCDALVFTAGIGEHSALVRARVCAGLGVFGIAVDHGRNETLRGGDLRRRRAHEGARRAHRRRARDRPADRPRRRIDVSSDRRRPLRPSHDPICAPSVPRPDLRPWGPGKRDAPATDRATGTDGVVLGRIVRWRRWLGARRRRCARPAARRCGPCRRRGSGGYCWPGSGRRGVGRAARSRR